MKKYIYPAIFQKEETGYYVFFPDLDGCQTEGDTLENALNMAKDALSIYIFDLEEDKKDIPLPSTPTEITLEKNQFISIIEFDMLEYRKKYDNKAVKKTLSIPSWLNSLAEDYNVNFSQLLQKALKEYLNVSEPIK